MDLTLLIALAAVTFLILLSIGLYLNSKSKPPVRENRPQGVPNRVRDDIPRRAQAARNRGARMRVQPQQQQDDEPAEEQDDKPTAEVGHEKIGAKKRAKLEAKAEKKAQREADEQQRQEKKKREQLAEEQRKKEEEKQRAEDKQREEEELRVKLEKENRDREEYMKMKQAFVVEEEGFEEDETEHENLLQEFVSYIKTNKVIVIEDLAAHFKLKTQAAIDRIKDLQNDDILTGVIDDRGKFIYVSPEEMEAVAKFIRQRGRISISELAENSNQLINLTAPTTS